MQNGPRLTSVAALLVAVIWTLSLTTYAQSPSPVSSAMSTADSLLPRNIVVPISVVNRFFAEVTREASSGQNLTAVGNAKATRSATYANSDSSKKVTITVDQYATTSYASSPIRKL